MSTTTVKLNFEDALGGPLDEHSVLVDVFSLDNSRHFRVTVPLSGQTHVAIRLEDCPSDVYRFMLTPANYRVLQFFLRLTEDSTVERKEPVVFPVNPDRVTGITAPAFHDLDTGLQQFLDGSQLALNGGRALSGADLYDQLPPLRKAALLNLFVKSSHTILGDDSTCFDHIQALQELDQDRLFAETNATLVEETMQEPFFRPVDFSLHTAKPPYHLISSFKTRDSHGNLQLTFSRNGDTGNDYQVDMDIDESAGIEHWFEVIRNSVSGATNPYNVREILIMAQDIKPLYGYKFAQRGVAVVSGAAGA